MQKLIKQIDAISKILLYAIVLPGFVYIMFCVAHHYRHPVRYSQAFETEQEAQEFKAKLKKHGMNTQIAVIYTVKGKEYFVRNGQECQFK